MKTPNSLGAVLPLLSFSSTLVAAQQGPYFVLGGGGMPLVIERVDPALSAGVTPSNHVHSIVGGNGFAPSMDFAQTQTSNCSTVSPKADKSNYWMPNLYFHDPKNQTFIRVPEQPYHKIYYKYGTTDNTVDTSIEEFPQEFRMIAGDMSLRSENDTLMGPYGDGLGWMCHGPDVSDVGFPKNFTSCPDGFAAAITMPSCWNGKDFDPKNPSAHVAYPTGDGITGCPNTHRVKRFPQIFVEYWLNTDTFDGLYSSTDSPFVLAMGDPTGYGFHVDFINGWKPGVLNSIMPTCNPGNTGTPPLSDDACFGQHGGVYTTQEMDDCMIRPVVNENVGWKYPEMDNPIGGSETYGGVVGDRLPGCNPIQWGPGPASIMSCDNSTAAEVKGVTFRA